MEEWQKLHIKKSMPELISLTEFNSKVNAELLANNILCEADIDFLDTQKNQNGKLYACKLCYEMLTKRTNAYKVLTKTLMQYKQTGAADILIRVPNDLCNKPLTYLDISTPIDGFKNTSTEVNGKRYKLHEFFPMADYKMLQSICWETLSELEFYDLFVTKERTFVLVNNSTPPEVPFYLTRVLSSRVKLEECLFKVDCPDVFVFKNTIARHKLSEIAKPHYTASSSSQLEHITSRFIYLDGNENWNELKTSANAPIHLIHYEADQELFLLEDTSAPSDTLSKYVSENEHVYISEDDFVKQQLLKDSGVSSVCICDKTGMGKTLLLASIARKMTENCVGRIIVFIPLSEFTADFSPSFPNYTLSHETALLNVLKYTSPSQQNQDLLFKMINADLLPMEILFDGFDEIPSDKVEWMKEVFTLIITNFPQVRIYVTSRPHMRSELESSLGVLAYNILPFNRQNQVDFMLRFWSQNVPSFNQISLQDYAVSCLEEVHKYLTKIEKEITRIPLLCQLVAKVYANQINYEVHSIKRRRFCDVQLKISKMYEEFIDLKIKLVVKNQVEYNNIKSVQMWHALMKLNIPKNHFYYDDRFKNLNPFTMSSKILKVGIIQKQTSSWKFIHHTFAEYLVADYFLTTLQDNKVYNSKEQNSNVLSLFKLLLNSHATEWPKYHYNFRHPVIVTFFDSAVGKIINSDHLINQIAALFTAISPDDFIKILCACCQHKLNNIFSLLKKAVMKCDSTRITQYFPTDYIYELLSICIRESTSEMFHSCVRLLTQALELNMSQFPTLLKMAVSCVNYAAVEYLVDRVPLKIPNILSVCVKDSYFENSNMVAKRESILYLLLNKDFSLIHEAPNLLTSSYIHLGLIKILIKYGTNLTSVTDSGQNMVTYAAEYMSSFDYHQFIQFMLTDVNAEFLFHNNKTWADPLSLIFERANLSPATLELFFSMAGIDRSMKNKHNNNLLFCAVSGDKLNNLQELINRGLNYYDITIENQSLLHVAACWAGVDMVKYLLSMKLKPNSRDYNGETPLHIAVKRSGRLQVVEILVESGANVQATNWKGQTALHLSVADNLYRLGSNKEVIKYLIGKELRVNQQDNDGNTPLHLCKDQEDKICLVKMGADIYARNKQGATSVERNP